MEDELRFFSRLKWFCFIPGLIMYFGTVDAFAGIISGILGIAAAGSFWMLLRDAENRELSRRIVETIRRAITNNSRAEHIIEIKRLSGGFIARVYLIKAGESVERINKTIHSQIENAGLRSYIWVFQMVDMEDYKELVENQKKMNKQLLEQMIKFKKRNKKK